MVVSRTTAYTPHIPRNSSRLVSITRPTRRCTESPSVAHTLQLLNNNYTLPLSGQKKKFVRENTAPFLLIMWQSW